MEIHFLFLKPGVMDSSVTRIEPKKKKKLLKLAEYEIEATKWYLD